MIIHKTPLRKISIKAVAIFLTLTVILSGIGYSLLNNSKTSANPATPVVVADLSDDQNERLNTALGYVVQAEKNRDTVVLTIYSELKADYREIELKPKEGGKWQVVKKEVKPASASASTPSPIPQKK